VSRIALAKGLPADFTQSGRDLITRFDRAYKVDFNPTASVLGAIVSQEVVKVITQRDFPSHGLAVYDSVTQKC
jgi:hypothetical protein